MEQAFDWIAEIARRVGAGDGFLFALGSYVAMILAERLGYLLIPEERPRWNEREAVTNVINSSVTAIGDALIGGVLFVGIYVAIYAELRLFDLPYAAWVWVLAFFANDLAYYADHRLAHRTGLFWAFHIPHHSSREMNLTVSSRGSVFSLGGTMSPAYFGLALIGIPAPMFFAVKFFANLWGIFNHTRLVKRMGVLDRWLCTPSNHRVHHGTDAMYLDRNYGQVLLIWDRMFGSWQPEQHEPTYGLVTQMDSQRIWDIQTWGVRWLIGQLRSTDSWTDRWRYLWRPPGWSHTGCHSTTQAILSGQPACVLAE